MNELAAGIIAHYDRHARAWDGDRNRGGEMWNDRPWHDRFLGALPGGAARVLDLGCGSGAPVARYVVGHGLRVTGVDASAAMIALCRERLSDQEWVVGDMRTVRLARRFDGILAWDSFFHLTPGDQRGMFDVFARHAAPGCALMFNSGSVFGEAIGSYRGDPLYHASLDLAEYRSLLESAGFEVIAHAVEDWQGGGGRTVWLARKAGPRVSELDWPGQAEAV